MDQPVFYQLNNLFSKYQQRAWLVLPNHQVFPAKALYRKQDTVIEAELVFNTSFNGYTEIITDPSYTDQIVLFTHPHIGSYGFDESHFQSKGPKCTAIVVHRLDDTVDYLTLETFSMTKWLLEAEVPIIYDVPSRQLTQFIREKGAMSCQLLIGDSFTRHKAESIQIPEAPRVFSADLLNQVSTKKKTPFGNFQEGKHPIAIYDFGVKQNIINLLTQRGCFGYLYPWNTPWQKVLEDHPKGVVLSNGPGDPSKFAEVIEEIKTGIRTIPILAICLGHQLLCQALGAKVFKLKFGHRGGNHPVRDYVRDRTAIAAHNHGFAISDDFLSHQPEWRLWFKNLNDNTLAGIRSDTHKVLSVQFHPEGAPGPHDTYYIFDEFVQWLAST